MTERQSAGLLGDWVRYRSAAGRPVLLATVLGSGLVTLDATVVNVALPAIGAELGGDFTSLQWTVNGRRHLRVSGRGCR